MSPTCVAEADPVSGLGDASRARCLRCSSFLRAGNDGDLCDPCRVTVASCMPFMPVSSHAEQAPDDVDLVKLVAGLVLTHDALHPGEKLYVREALADYGIEADHVDCQHAANKMRRRHGLVIAGEPREPGYRLVEWRRLSPSLSPHPAVMGDDPAQLRLFDGAGRPLFRLKTAASGSD